MKARGALMFLFSIAGVWAADAAALPYLQRRDSGVQLIVDGRPFLIRGGEVGNSSATNAASLAPHWSKFKALNLNTLLVPVYWDLLEPAEHRFDFSLVDQVLQQARDHRLRLVLLWFASWKNSMSCYAPAWVKRDVNRFPRATDRHGARQEILSPFSAENQRADTVAFAALQGHLAEVDGTQHTVIMVQVENEIGMLPTACDHSTDANRAFASSVPSPLLDYFAAHANELTPELKSAWAAAGGKKSGTWSEVFGGAAVGEEIFMAWHFARYTEGVAAAGKKEYPLPMFVNAALIRPGHQPGQYPSGGPLPHLANVWRAAAPSIDFLSPDIYFQNFIEWARRYKTPGNPLFIPEAQRGSEASVNSLYAFGALDAIGFSPFGIESMADPAAKALAASYDLVTQLEPLILDHQGNGTMAGLLSEGPEQRQPQPVRMGDTMLYATFDRGGAAPLADGAVASSASASAPPPSGGLVINTSPDEFIFAGTGLVVTFASLAPGTTAGILRAEEGRFQNGEWHNLLWLGGDQTHQGRHVRLEPGRFSIQRVKLYRY